MGKTTTAPKKKKKPAKRGRKKKSVQEKIEETSAKQLFLKSFVEGGNLSKIKDLEHFFTKIMADQLGVNHGRFVYKLRNPAKFSVKDILRFAYYINISPNLLFVQISKEIGEDQKILPALRKVKPIKK